MEIVERSSGWWVVDMYGALKGPYMYRSSAQKWVTKRANKKNKKKVKY